MSRKEINTSVSVSLQESSKIYYGNTSNIMIPVSSVKLL